jgi:hypothetical protein
MRVPVWRGSFLALKSVSVCSPEHGCVATMRNVSTDRTIHVYYSLS